MSRFRSHAFALALVAAACSDTSTPTPNRAPIDIGSAAALTGPLSGTGQDNTDAANLAVEQINAAGGVLGRTLRLIVEDDQTTVEGARAAYTKLLEQKVTAVIGPSSSAQVVGIADLVSAGRTVTIGRTSTSPLITTLADDDFFFRLAPGDQYSSKVLANLVREAKLEKLCIVYREDTYGTYLTDAISKELGDALPITRAKYNPNQADFSGVLKACDPLLCSAGGADAGAGGAPGCSPDAKVGLVMVTYVTDGKAVLQDATAWSASKQRFFFTDGARDVELLKLGLPAEKLQGAVGTIPSGPDPRRPEGDLLAAYGAAYQTRFGGPAPAYSQNAYDAVYTIAAAIEIAGTTERVAVRDALRKTSTPGGTPVSAGKWADIRAAIAKKEQIDLRGAGGNLDFDANGDIAPPYYYRVWRIDQGASVTDDTVTVTE